MFKNPNSLIVKLNNVKHTDKADVIFVFPGLEGNCDAFKELADYLEAKNVQMIGLQFTTHVPHVSLEEAARYYILKIDSIIRELNFNVVNNIAVCGYSFGGLLAIEICHQMETKFRFENDINFVISNLILLESSHLFFRVGVHHNSKKFGKLLPQTDIFVDNTVYTATLSIYISAITGRLDDSFKFELYDYLKSSNCFNLDDAIQKALDYIITNKYYSFDSKIELEDMKSYLKLLMLKSNAGFIYSYDSIHKLRVPVVLIKTNNFMYRKFINDLYYLDDKHNEPCKLVMNENDYSLGEIAEHTSVFVCQNGNHWTFVSESAKQIADFVSKILFKNKILKSKI
jgi:hypothetical protein